MIPKEIHVSIKFVKNMGNYQSFSAEAGMVAILEPEEVAETAFKTAWKTVADEVRTQIKNAKVAEEKRNG